MFTVVTHGHVLCLVSFNCWTDAFDMPVYFGRREMDGEKNSYWFNGGVALAAGIIMASIIFGWSYSNAKKGDEAIMVTGSAKKRIKSDLVVWSAGVSAQSGQLAD